MLADGQPRGTDLLAGRFALHLRARAPLPTRLTRRLATGGVAPIRSERMMRVTAHLRVAADDGALARGGVLAGLVHAVAHVVLTHLHVLVRRNVRVTTREQFCDNLH